MRDGATYNAGWDAGWEMGRKQGLREAAAEIERLKDDVRALVPGALHCRGEAALDAVRHRVRISVWQECEKDLRAILAVLENLDARLKALEEK